jgi:UDP-N-acetylmuramate dehydrogenase
MQIQSNYSLKSINTFGVNATAEYLLAIDKEETLLTLLEDKKWLDSKKMVWGGGSNILVTKNIVGLVLKNELKGISLVAETEEDVLIKAAAGENWHQFVRYTIDQNWAGLENLSLIPGCVGASPMQNIGAYGVEIKDVFESLEAIHLITGEKVVFTKTECAFGYRESVFKQTYKNQFFINSVTFRLSKKPVFHTSYGAIQTQLAAMNVAELSLKAVSDAVIAIRSSKLPDPAVLGNAGSFFKNPEITSEQAAILKSEFPNIVTYDLPNGMVKLAAGWLIEQAGWKGKRIGDCGVHVNQALVLVNYGNATGKEIINLSQQIIDSVFSVFNVHLEREVNIV